MPRRSTKLHKDLTRWVIAWSEIENVSVVEWRQIQLGPGRPTDNRNHMQS